MQKSLSKHTVNEIRSFENFGKFVESGYENLTISKTTYWILEITKTEFNVIITVLLVGIKSNVDNNGSIYFTCKIVSL